MHGYKIILLDGSLYLEDLLGVLVGVLLHAAHQRIGIAVKVRVVMAKAVANELAVRFLHLAGRGHAQEGNGEVFE
jgi:hypothetical protein